jgi:hypothetical protein
MAVKLIHGSMLLADLLVTKRRPHFKLALNGVLNKGEFLSGFLAGSVVKTIHSYKLVELTRI